MAGAGLILHPCASPLQDYMQNVHGKEIDLLRTTVKVPGKRLPRATTAAAPSASPKANGLAKERSSSQLAGGTGKSWCGGHRASGRPSCSASAALGFAELRTEPLLKCPAFTTFRESLWWALAFLCRSQVSCS